MKSDIKILNLILLIFVILSFLVSMGQTNTSVIQTTASSPTHPIKIDSVTPYDNGVVVTLSYTNYTDYKGYHTYTEIYVYFFNRTAKTLLYNSAPTNCPSAFTFVYDGKLYLVVEVTTYKSFESYVYVFKGLKLIDNYTTNYMFIIKHEPLFNLSAPILKSINFSILSSSTKITLMLSETNITFVNQCPVIVLQLPKGVLVVLKEFLSISAIRQGKFYPYVFNFTMYSYNGKIIWSEVYHIFLKSPLLYVISQYSESVIVSSFLKENYATLVGNELYILNVTGIDAKNLTANITIVGINLKNGEIVNKIPLNNVPPYQEALLNIGGKLYVTIFNFNNETTVMEYNGSGMTLVTKIPVKIEVVQSFPPGIRTPPGQTVYYIKYIDVAVPRIFYDFGKYLVIVNPTSTGYNVTDIYSGGVANYTLNENVQIHLISDRVIVLGQNDNFSLAFLNGDGFLEGIVNIGKADNLTSIFARCLCINNTVSYPEISVAEVNPHEYYIVKVYSSSEVTVYEVTLNGSTDINVNSIIIPVGNATYTTHLTKIYIPTSKPLTTPILVSIIIVVVILALVIKNRIK
ncbi:hypothetical protein EWF20_00745 [Sulfolobus sp. S-194]|uniref:hypothetical protein n=1 Tax=Sulfolobus sp. S-194 TaxID=2512240 RepID=UPI0014373AF0|nr:hypothetical protein [Sulfolobus sp. S-194]QIW22833.1 hypothetical protein EWF20_00745 [Sulfolobus sp. S-194]